MALFDTLFNKKGKAKELCEKGNGLVNSGNYHEAIAAYTEAVTLDSKNEDAWVNQGVAYQRIRDHRKAITCFLEALKANPRSLNAIYNAGVSYGELNEFHKAIECYDTVLSADPNDPDAQFNRQACMNQIKLGSKNEHISSGDSGISIKRYGGNI